MNKVQNNGVDLIKTKSAMMDIGGLLLLAFFLRLGFLMNSDNFSGFSPMLNIITALKAFRFFSVFENIYYQPLPLYLYSLLLSVWMGVEQVISARFLSLFFGSLSVPAFYFFSRKLFGKKNAFYSSLILCFYPVHMIMSVITSPDIIVFFLLLVTLNLILDENYFSSAVILAISCGFSYLAWVFVPILILFLGVRAKGKKIINLKDIAAYSVIAFSVPLIITFLIYIKYPATGIFYRNFYLADSFWDYLLKYGASTKLVIKALFIQPGAVFIIIGLAEIMLMLKQRKAKFYNLFFIFGMIFLLICLKLFRDEICVLGQGINFLAVMVIPFFVLALEYFLKRFRCEKIILPVVCFFCVILLINSVYLKPRLPDEVKEVVSWLRENISDKSIIYLKKDAAGYYSSIIMLSGLPQGNFKYVNNFDNLPELVKGQNNYLLLSFDQNHDSNKRKSEDIAILKGYTIKKIKHKKEN